MLFQHKHTHTFIPPYPHFSYSPVSLSSYQACFLAARSHPPPISDVYLSFVSQSLRWYHSIIVILWCWIIVLISVWSFFAYAKTVDDYDVISPLSPILLFRITTTPRNLNITILKCVFSHFFTSVFFAIYRYTFFFVLKLNPAIWYLHSYSLASVRVFN